MSAITWQKMLLLAGLLVLGAEGEPCQWGPRGSRELPTNDLSFEEIDGAGILKFEPKCLANPQSCFLGRGAFGVVYRAVLVKTRQDGKKIGEEVAVKMTKLGDSGAGSGDEMTGYTSFRNEWKLTHLLRQREGASHPNVVRLRRAGFFNSVGKIVAKAEQKKATCGVLVMELVKSAVTLQEMFFTRGVSVDDITRLGRDPKWRGEMTDLNAENFVINTLGPELSDVTTTIMIQIISALEFFDSHGIVHFDLKPDNILVQVIDPTDGRLRVIVTDFGLAIARENHRKGDRMSQGNFVYNTNGQSCSFGTDASEDESFFITGSCKGFDLRAARVILAELISGVPAWLGCSEEWTVRNDEVSQVNLHARRGVLCILPPGAGSKHVDFHAYQRIFSKDEKSAKTAIETVARQTGAKLTNTVRHDEIVLSDAMYDIVSVIGMMGAPLDSPLSVLYVLCGDSTFQIFPTALCSKYMKLAGQDEYDITPPEVPAAKLGVLPPVPESSDERVLDKKVPPQAPGVDDAATHDNALETPVADHALRGGGGGGDAHRPLKLVLPPSGREGARQQLEPLLPSGQKGAHQQRRHVSQMDAPPGQVGGSKQKQMLPGGRVRPPIRQGRVMGALSPLAGVGLRKRAEQVRMDVDDATPQSPIVREYKNKLPAIKKHLLESSLAHLTKARPDESSSCSPRGVVVVANTKNDCTLGRSNAFGRDLVTPCVLNVYCGGKEDQMQQVVFDRMFGTQCVPQCRKCTVYAPSPN